MSLKRDMLVEAGITDKSVIDNIMQEAEQMVQQRLAQFFPR